jgi:hypothetical protein
MTEANKLAKQIKPTHQSIAFCKAGHKYLTRLFSQLIQSKGADFIHRVKSYGFDYNTILKQVLLTPLNPGDKEKRVLLFILSHLLAYIREHVPIFYQNESAKIPPWFIPASLQGLNQKTCEILPNNRRFNIKFYSDSQTVTLYDKVNWGMMQGIYVAHCYQSLMSQFRTFMEGAGLVRIETISPQLFMSWEHNNDQYFQTSIPLVEDIKSVYYSTLLYGSKGVYSHLPTDTAENFKYLVVIYWNQRLFVHLLCRNRATVKGLQAVFKKIPSYERPSVRILKKMIEPIGDLDKLGLFRACYDINRSTNYLWYGHSNILPNTCSIRHNFKNMKHFEGSQKSFRVGLEKAWHKFVDQVDTSSHKWLNLHLCGYDLNLAKQLYARDDVWFFSST